MHSAATRAEEIKQDPQFQELVRERTRFGWILTILVLIIYFGFILLIAFAPGLLGQSLAGGVTTLGIPLGIGVILSAVVFTGLYVLRANNKFDALTALLLERHK
jgi:uncharacterized membrane protein (DUF485 family)